jgi:hypothetical protein
MLTAYQFLQGQLRTIYEVYEIFREFIYGKSNLVEPHSRLEDEVQETVREEVVPEETVPQEAIPEEVVPQEAVQETVKQPPQNTFETLENRPYNLRKKAPIKYRV